MFNSIYQNKKVLVTGHTGFKGSWLALWLQHLGAEVSGIGLTPTETNHWDLLNLPCESNLIDIRDIERLKKKVKEINPDIVFHLAAQPLVRYSYGNPLETWSTNVMGTVNVLDCCRDLENLSAIVAITSDKCYENQEWVWGYREADPMGGHDPYSASKGCSELVIASYRRSFFHGENAPLLASCRAGNVIGGGDWSVDRLIPDLVRAVTDNKQLKIRYPKATRPWQHVLDCLSGYLLLGQRLLENDKSCAEAWNFGPEKEGNRTVVEVLTTMKKFWQSISWDCENLDVFHEAQFLHLDTSKAKSGLKWKPVWCFEEAAQATADWYKQWAEESKLISLEQIIQYTTTAEKLGLVWAEK